MIQRAGRAGRQAGLQARFVLLVQPTVFHEGKSTRQAGEPIEYVKPLEPGLRSWVETPLEACRREVADVYFDNPIRAMRK